MRIVDEHYDEAFYTSEVFERYFGDARLAVFDIETSGLSPARSKIVIGGALTPDVGGCRLRQFFSEGAHEERDLLALYADVLNGADVVFSYNGDAFDIPFVNARLRERRMEAAFAGCLSIDLYKVARNFTGLRGKLPNLKQKSVEDYLGLWKNRTDRISGADSVSLYYEYLAAPTPDLLRRLLLHNSDDVRQLTRLLRLLDEADMHAVAFHMGFPVSHGDALLIVEGARLKGNALEAWGRCLRSSRPLLEHSLYGEAFQAFFREADGSFALKLPCVGANGLVAADLDGLGLEHPRLEDGAAASDGFLTLKHRSWLNYEKANLLVGLALKKTLDLMWR
ncbi:MAG: ribonuclease H-like domain-containing protein [Clostridiales Family XIII bacterium]|jgi:uncharacterized protein YprB with RNaseH-like and TPR domain|nr:ribonuclease H-like domain-containing protein [Clostridiales Family XIII bacterium]